MAVSFDLVEGGLRGLYWVKDVVAREPGRWCRLGGSSAPVYYLWFGISKGEGEAGRVLTLFSCGGW